MDLEVNEGQNRGLFSGLDFDASAIDRSEYAGWQVCWQGDYPTG